MESKKYYVTTPIYYPNGKFHIGTAYTTYLADFLKKYKKQRGYDVIFTTGIDEHGQKIETAARENGKEPKEYVDEMAKKAVELWGNLNIDYDIFVRTTDEEHEKTVQNIFEYFLKNGDIYKGEFEGNYCKSCEAYFTDLQLVDGKHCPDCGKEVKLMKEEAYFFNMKKYADRLIKHYEENPNFILPANRKNELLNNFLKVGLEDLCVTRTSFNWGIKVKSDPKHVIYVWLGALTNYITFMGYDIDKKSEKFNKYWPCDVHLVGKDIIRFHGIYWPIFLMSLGLELPKTIYAHNWYVMSNGKMSKSKGNVIYPEQLLDVISKDALRYIILREMPYSHDGVLSLDNIITRYNTELCNDLSNLLYRLLGMMKKYEASNIFETVKMEKEDLEMEENVKEAIAKFEENIDNFMIQKAIEEAWKLISKTNKYIDVKEPWKLYKEGKKEELNTFFYTILNTVYAILEIIFPIMPETYEKVMGIYNFEKECSIIDEEKREKQVFGRIEVRPDFESKPIFVRFTEEEEEKIKKLFNK